ncbi:MAG: orotidine-5'-phosphate decarboxylase [Spirochaetia bacterium]
MNRIEWILRIEEIGALKFGNFVLKNGDTSPFYLDLRMLPMNPELLKETARLLATMLNDGGVEYDVIVGIPYAAIPIATALSLEVTAPLVCLRKERKQYGSGGMLVGSVKSGSRCLVVDDLVTSGLSKREAAEVLEAEGLQVTDIVVLVDRSKNAAAELLDAGYRLHSLVKIGEIVDVLKEAGRLDETTGARITEFVQTGSEPQTKAVQNSLAERVRNTMRETHSNLVLSLDVTTQDQFFAVLSETAGSIAMLKTHIDILEDFDPSFLARLRHFTEKYRFLILEDRKFADIGNTVRRQFRAGRFTIAEWAEFVTVHMISGEAILEGLFEGVADRGAFLLARMSSRGNLIDENYTRRVIEIGSHHACVTGYIGHGSNADDLARLREMIPAEQLLLVPGVRMEAGRDALGQQYLTVDDAVSADMIIVGRGIYRDSNPGAKAEEYRLRAWERIEGRGGV